MIAETSRQLPVYLLVPTDTVDGYGEPSLDWRSPTAVRLYGAEIQGRASTTMDYDVDQAQSTKVKQTATLIVVSYDLATLNRVTAASRVRQGDEVWRIAGTPIVKRTLMHSNVHLVAQVERTVVGAPNG